MENWKLTAAAAALLTSLTLTAPARADIEYYVTVDGQPASSLVWPFISNELRFWNGTQWVQVGGTDCFGNVPKGCSYENGYTLYPERWDGLPLAIGDYLVTVDGSFAGYGVVERKFFHDGGPTNPLVVINLERIKITLGEPVWWIDPPKNAKSGPVIHWGYSITNEGGALVKVETFTIVQARGPGGYATFQAGGNLRRTLHPGRTVLVEESWEMSGAALSSYTFLQVQVAVPGDPTNLYDVVYFAVPAQ